MTLNEAYDILDIENTAPDEMIKENYRWLVKFYHPDNNLTKDIKEFLKIIEAYIFIKEFRLNYYVNIRII